MGNIHSGQEGITRLRRDFPPTHYLFKIESYSLLLKTNVEKYESGVFEAGGYKWSLIFYPNGKTDATRNGYISLYLAIAETERLPLGWEVNISFKLFVYDQRQDKYLTIQDADGAIKRFYQMNTEWGFDQLLPLNSFHNASNGYLVGDSCVFGAEVFVIKPTAKLESLSMIKKPANRTMTWKIENFSNLDKDYYFSELFSVGELKWRLLVFPNGYANAKFKGISAYLVLDETCNLPPKRKVYAKFKLRIRNQINDNHIEFKGQYWFCLSRRSCGFSRLISLKHVFNLSKGFFLNNALIVQGEITVMSKVKCV